MSEKLLTVGYFVFDKIDGRELPGGAAFGIAANGTRLNQRARVFDTAISAPFGETARSERALNIIRDNNVNLQAIWRVPSIDVPENTIDHSARTLGWNDNGLAAYFTSEFPGYLDFSHVRSHSFIHLASSHPAHTNAILRELDDQHQILSYAPGPKIAKNPSYLSYEALSRSTIVFFNKEEWNAARSILRLEQNDPRLGPSIVVVTNGEQGSDIAFDSQIKHIDAIPTQETNDVVTDSTGAGDAYALGFLAAYSKGLDPVHCGIVGTELATRVLNNHGVLIPTQDLQNIAFHYL